ncbi:hypothetical protein J2T17_001682 [Paenibacillus mucilaginosus]|uniref:hypothetical protein n=1 Tax=Paenibacillus mucilaginosus TaxID=61624 RepID=UPI003D263989
MRTYLLVSQCLYAVSLMAWFPVWGMSFMVFDQGIALWNTLFFLSISAYPVAVLGCSVAAWMLRKRRQRTAVAVNLAPVIWIAALGGLFLFY